MRDEETTLDPDLEWGEGMSGRVDGPVWTRPAGLGGRALAAGRDQSFLSFFLLILSQINTQWASARKPKDQVQINFVFHLVAFRGDEPCVAVAGLVWNIFCSALGVVRSS